MVCTSPFEECELTDKFNDSNANRLTAERINQAIEKIQRRVSELEDINRQKQLDMSRLHAFKAVMINDLREIFGGDSQEFKKYERWDMYDAQRQMSVGFQNPARAQARDEKAYRQGIGRTLTELGNILQMLEKKKNSPGIVPLNASEATVLVFSNESAPFAQAVLTLLKKMELNIHHISQRQDSSTIINRIADNSAHMAIVVVEADTDSNSSTANPKLMLDAGCIIGKFGKEHICILTNEALHALFAPYGCACIRLDENGEKRWQIELGLQLRCANIAVDLNKAASQI
ncbi:MAG TPA: TIR domain-containing protein [Candidatus Obscuribacterales bacterium]